MSERCPARSSTARAVIIAVLMGGTALALWGPPRPRPEEGTAGHVSASAALRGNPPANEGYARAHTPRPFRFPDDHGPHPEFRTEWWYFTGNLVAVAKTH